MESLQTFLFIIQIILSLIIVLFVLLQQTDGDSLSGIGGGAANAKMLSKRSSGSPISKMTMVVFILFMLNSLFLATISARHFNNNNSTIENFLEKNKKDTNKTEINETKEVSNDNDTNTNLKNTSTNNEESANLDNKESANLDNKESANESANNSKDTNIKEDNKK